jgi:methyl-accepting chemotaxis protein
MSADPGLYAAWPLRLASLACAVCGCEIAATADLPVPQRLIGAAILGCALLVCLFSRTARPLAAAENRAPPAEAAPEPVVTALDAAAAGTARDLQTAMALFGSTIVDQVDTSVSTVLRENAQMREMASEMASASTQAKEQFQLSMSRAVEAEHGIEQLNSFSADLGGSIQVIGSAVKNSLDIVKGATAQAAATRGCVETMATLSGAVTEVVTLISDIARQIRMLSLNATIEAARAGEAGLGFAVVAAEVKQLAQATARATRSIDEKISQMAGTVAASVTALQVLVDMVESIDAASSEIGRAITDQESLAVKVSSSLEQMRGAVFTLSREIREAAQIAANSGMLSDLVLETAHSVDSLMQGLKGTLRDIGTGMGPLAAIQAQPAEELRDAA